MLTPDGTPQSFYGAQTNQLISGTWQEEEPTIPAPQASLVAIGKMRVSYPAQRMQTVSIQGIAAFIHNASANPRILEQE